MKIRIDLLCFGRTRMLAFYFLPFFAGGFAVLEEEEEEELCMLEAVSYWTRHDHFQFGP